jgi:hypothetical protein
MGLAQLQPLEVHLEGASGRCRCGRWRWPMRRSRRLTPCELPSPSDSLNLQVRFCTR